MSKIVFNVGYQAYAIPFNAKLVEALAAIQASAVPVESFYESGTPVRFVLDPDRQRVEIRVVGDEEVAEGVTRKEAEALRKPPEAA